MGFGTRRNSRALVEGRDRAPARSYFKAIGFNDEASLLADEVRDKRSNRLLSAELRAFQLAIAQHRP